MAAGALFTVVLAIIVSILYKSALHVHAAEDDQAERSKKIQASMYTIIHNLALPNFNENMDITERFILLLPGEVLDYYDYCPLSELKPNEYNDPDRLPPDENTFKLGDTVPTLNPLAGGTTGKSLATIYEDILYSINNSYSSSDVFESNEYTSAMNFLQTEVQDPENETAGNVTRYELYYHYKKMYYDTKLLVNEWLVGNKSQMSDLSKYETWYHDNYETLTAYTSAAYTQWLVSGLKGTVEDKISVVDDKSIRTEVEEAKQILRDTEEPSLDGGSKYYPTHFVPSNWYQYLLAGETKLTTDEIQAKINDLTSRKDQIQSMMDTNVPTDAQLKAVQDQTDKTVSNAKTKMQNKTLAYACYRFLCQQKRASSGKNSSKSVATSDGGNCAGYESGNDPCSKINDIQTDLDKARQDLVFAQTERSSVLNQLNAYSASAANLKNIINDLTEKIAQLQKELKNAPKPIPPDVARAKLNGTGQLTPEEREQNWMSFSFDSESSTKSVKTDSKTYKAAVSFSAGGALWSVSGGASYSHASQDFAEKMSNSDVTISGKLLKVTINRNWFQPSLFAVGKLQMDKDANRVSPGPMQDEQAYVNEAMKDQLPEYTTGFLLAKDISMRFRGVDSATTSHAIQESASSHISGSYGPFSASASFSYGHKSSNLKVSSQADGFQIDIPGAQIIGYFTSVLPKFPL